MVLKRLAPRQLRLLLSRFSTDQFGGATIWVLAATANLAVAGIGVDIINDFRMRTALQSTADIAALAAVVELPDKERAVSRAALFASQHAEFNSVPDLRVEPDDVIFGHWDERLQEFDPDGSPQNAAKVVLPWDGGADWTISEPLLAAAGLALRDFEAVSLAVQISVPRSDCGTGSVKPRADGGCTRRGTRLILN